MSQTANLLLKQFGVVLMILIFLMSFFVVIKNIFLQFASFQRPWKIVDCFFPTFNPVSLAVRKVIVSKQCEFNSCSCERTVQPRLVSCKNETGFTLPFIVMYSQKDSVKFSGLQVYYARKLHLQTFTDLCKVFGNLF